VTGFVVGPKLTQPWCRRISRVLWLVFRRELAMRTFLVAALIAGSVISFEAKAQSRAGDAALGAVSGAVVLGPIGAVAGAAIGFTAGPAIAHSWGLRRSSSRARVQRASQASATAEPQTTGSVAPSPPARSTVPTPVANKAPPVQGLE
jgi:hypothetical protein